MAKSKFRESAKGQDCRIRVPFVCNGDPATVVLCHKSGGGMALKENDIFGAFGCAACHAWIDGGWANDPNCESRFEMKAYFYDGMVETQRYWQSIGLLPTP